MSDLGPEHSKPGHGRLNGLIYCCIFGKLQQVARDNGYSLCVHGSMDRDFDLVAIPWTDEAVDPVELIHVAFVDALRPDSVSEVELKPHGRLAWFLCVGSGLGVDISVMPRKEKQNT